MCVELSSKIKQEVHEITLEEQVLGGKLVRPLHHTEKVSLIVQNVTIDFFIIRVLGVGCGVTLGLLG